MANNNSKKKQQNKKKSQSSASVNKHPSKQKLRQSSSSIKQNQREERTHLNKHKTTQKPLLAKGAVDPPLECTHTEFMALLGDAKQLSSRHEASRELLDCARYGEVDACRAILDVWGGYDGGGGGGGGGDGGQSVIESNSSLKKSTSVSFIDETDLSHSTALHKAAANGHHSTVQLLLSRGASHLPNDSGNTPLHWGAGAGHAKVVTLLLNHFDALAGTTIDVLFKNAFGRSALTEGFTSGDTPTVQALLNHDSAEEERLIGGVEKEEVEDEDIVDLDKTNDMENNENGHECVDDSKECGILTSNKGKKERGGNKLKSIVHEFDFLGEISSEVGDFTNNKDSAKPSVLVRELPITHADDPFGQSSIEDTTGLGIWCASLVMSRWLSSPSLIQRMKGKRVLELGAGCGVPGLAVAVYGQPKSVTITDLNPQTIDNIEYNIKLNGKFIDKEGSKQSELQTETVASNHYPCETIIASSIDWGDESTYPNEKVDFVIGSDLIYQKEIVPLLKKVISGLLKGGGDDDDTSEDDENNLGTFLYVAPESGRDGLPEFISAMKSEGYECITEIIAPDEYRDNPLKSGDEEDYFLHFNELMSTIYILYEFRRCRRG